MTVDLDVGGMGEVVASLARGLPAHGVETAVLHLASTDAHDPGGGAGGRLSGALRDHGVPVSFAASEADGRRWLADHRPDVISAHIAPDWVLEASQSLGVPFVETLHLGTTLRDWDSEAPRGRAITTLVAVSDLIREQYLAGNPAFPADRIVTIPNGVEAERMPDVDRRRARAWLGVRDEFLFVSLARHSLEKNSYGLVSAFTEVALSHPDALLLIAGRVDDPAYAQQVRRLRDRSAGRARVHLRDHSSHPSSLLAAADAFVLDSFFEGWALASMEALCSGTPVVMSEVGGAREQVGDTGERGYVVPNPLGEGPVTWEAIRAVRFAPQVNRDALVAAMRAMLGERERWTSSRLQLSADSRDRFSVETCLRKHAAVLMHAAGTTEPLGTGVGRC